MRKVSQFMQISHVICVIEQIKALKSMMWWLYSIYIFSRSLFQPKTQDLTARVPLLRATLQKNPFLKYENDSYCKWNYLPVHEDFLKQDRNRSENILIWEYLSWDFFFTWLKVIFTYRHYRHNKCGRQKLKTFLSFINCLKINGKNTQQRQMNSEKDATKQTFKSFLTHLHHTIYI